MSSSVFCVALSKLWCERSHACGPLPYGQRVTLRLKTATWGARSDTNPPQQTSVLQRLTRVMGVGQSAASLTSRQVT